MKYLLDTHAVIWFVDNSPKIPLRIKEVAKHPANEFFISSLDLTRYPQRPFRPFAYCFCDCGRFDDYNGR